MRILISFLMLVCVLCACGTGSAGPVPGKTTLPQLLEQMGQPSMVWSEGDGSLQMEFSHVHDGTGTHMARVSPGGVLVSLQQVLTEANVMTLQIGMSQEQVRRHLGRPISIDKGATGDVWHWPLDSKRPAEWQVDAHFGATGTLLEVGRSRVRLGQSARQSGLQSAQAGQEPHS